MRVRESISDWRGDVNEGISIAILAGGKSIRMGQDKGFLLLEGKPIISHVVEAVRSLKFPILIVANDVEKYAEMGLPIFSDAIPDMGSLGGVFTAITRSVGEYTLCVACDMPFLQPDLLKGLIALSPGYDVTVARVGGKSEPLLAVYRKTCLPVIQRSIEANLLKINALYESLNVRYVEESTLRMYDPELRSLINVNTPDEWQKINAG